MGKIKKIVIHTTAGSRGADIDAVRRYHMEKRGWHDTGYHYLVRDNGEIQQGRREWQCGAHAIGYNTTSLGVAFAGHHDRYPWSPAARENGLNFIAHLVRKHGLTPADVIGHRETGARKSCPGTQVDMDEVRAEIARRLGRTVA